MLGVCRFLSVWSTIVPSDFSEKDIRPILTSIVAELDSAEATDDNANTLRHLSDCRTKLKKILNASASVPKMQCVSFYREGKEGRGGMMEISRKVMDPNMISVVATHLLEWSVQVFDNVSESLL